MRAIGLFLLFWPLLWLSLKWGLDAEDKAALGKFGRRLRLRLLTAWRRAMREAA